MWGIVPAAGKGSRIQPLAFSKELLPLGAGCEGESRRPRAVSDFLMERMAEAGVRRVCFVISADKSDILEHYGGSAWSAFICYAIQPKPAGLCDAIFQALPVIAPDEPVVVGLPDTIWFPENGLALLPAEGFSLLLFPVDEPRLFDSVECDPDGRVQVIRVKQADAVSRWIWGAFRLQGSTLHALKDLWLERGRVDEYFGTLVNAWIERGGEVWGVRAGERYFDVGTMDGYLDAIRVLSGSNGLVERTGAAG
ncbi:MAG TPA: sugar phosphate nucleotidyltransferase [Bryobacteraceae bacterium]|jgi:dTDP-glucose pyrophosphorylase|nr:sugar phosphate nucleotidyltransferase [Bryobacteraceae bacterium]